MERRFEKDLRSLKADLLAMGGFVEQALQNATDAWFSRDKAKLEDVHRIEKMINEKHLEIDKSCLEVLARLSPFATDLRLILSIIKMNADLERIGDQAVNIANNAGHYLSAPEVRTQLQFPEMSNRVRVMVREALDAFLKEDIDLARQVLASDDAVDDLKRQAFSILLPFMKENPDHIEGALDLLLIARNLERMADHATNIAEDVIFAFTGEDIRHSLRPKAKAISGPSRHLAKQEKQPEEQPEDMQEQESKQKQKQKQEQEQEQEQEEEGI